MFLDIGTTLRVPGSPDHTKADNCREEEEREKEKAKDDPRGLDEHSLSMNKYKIQNGRQKSVLGGPKDRNVRKA